jgi:serine/threonine protein phosphatase PrpC
MHTLTHTHYTHIRRTLADWPSLSKDRFVVIASDGLWDEVTGEEAGKVLEEMGIEEGIQELGE